MNEEFQLAGVYFESAVMVDLSSPHLPQKQSMPNNITAVKSKVLRLLRDLRIHVQERTCHEK